MNIIQGIIGSIIAAGIVAIAVAVYKRWFGRMIKITNPTENGFFAPMEMRGQAKAYPVSGTLKYLPKGHKIWLIAAHEGEAKYWPQGMEPVEWDKDTGTWKGYATVFGWNRVSLFAVLAPMTTQEYFDYFVRVSGKTTSEPLLKIPDECKRRDLVLAKVPPS